MEQSKLKNPSVISNPPYNINWNRKVCHFSDKNTDIVPESNANFAFVMRALELADDKAAFILPRGCLTGNLEKEARKYLVDNGYLSAVLSLPQKMFESTSIPVHILFFEKNNKYRNAVFMDLSGQTLKSERLQRGQVGKKCHENRVYKKLFESLDPDKITQISRIIKERQNLPDWAVIATHDAIANNDYVLYPKLYLPVNENKMAHRPLEYIVDELNRIVELRNVLRLVINTKTAKDIDIYETAQLQDQSKSCSENIAGIIEKLTGKKLVMPDYIRLSKNRNEITFQNNHPELISEILLSILQMWKQHIIFLNNQENRLLAELRDTLLPKMMGGEIDMKDVEIGGGNG